MKNLTLNNSSKKYFEYLDSQKKSKTSKDGKIRFDVAEGLFDIPQRFSNKLGEIDLSSISSLPDRNSSELRVALAKFLCVNVENISVFSGSDEIIEIIPRLYLDSVDTSLCIVPTFSRMIISSKKVGAKVEMYSLGKENKFRLEGKVLEKFIEKIKRVSPKIVWICSPNNPTGIVTSLDQIKGLIDTFPGVLFVINEVYQEYFSLDPQKSAVSLISKNSNLLVIRSFSKAFGLAGVRIGYVVGSADRISEIDKFRTMYNTSVVAQKLGVEALRDTEYVSSMIATVKKERDQFLDIVSSDCDNIEVVPGSETNLLLVRHKNKDLFQELYDREALASDWRTSDGIKNDGYVRISIGQKNQNQKMASLLKEIN